MAKDIYFRQGVYGFRLLKPVRKALSIVKEVYKEEGQPFILITSTFESSEHLIESLHYVDSAVDILKIFGKNYTYDNEREMRTYEKINKRITKELEPIYGNFDVVLHKGSHIHVEWDPDVRFWTQVP